MNENISSQMDRNVVVLGKMPRSSLRRIKKMFVFPFLAFVLPSLQEISTNTTCVWIVPVVYSLPFQGWPLG